MIEPEDEEPRYTLYRMDWEEDGEKTFSFGVVPADKPAPEGNEFTQNFTARATSDEEQDAYRAGFEDGYDMAIAQERIREYEAEHPDESMPLLWDEDDEDFKIE